MSNEFSDAITQVRMLLDEMETLLSEAEPDGPHGLLEAAQEAQHQIDRAVHIAIVPVLKRYEQDQIAHAKQNETDQ